MAYKDYEESSAVKAAQQAARDNYSKKPGEYQESQWAGALRDTMGQLQNRKSFSYDVNGDALYQQYKDKYTQQGKLAMQDTVGQVSALTGGYANSYAATAGQQVYQASLSNLNDVVPQLYSLAYDKYNQDLSNLQNMASMYNALEEQNRSNYQNAVTNWTNEQNRLDSLAMNMATQDLNKYNTNASNYYNEQASAAQAEENSKANYTEINNFKKNLLSKDKFKGNRLSKFLGLTKYNSYDEYVLESLDNALANGSISPGSYAQLVAEYNLE